MNKDELSTKIFEEIDKAILEVINKFDNKIAIEKPMSIKIDNEIFFRKIKKTHH